MSNSSVPISSPTAIPITSSTSTSIPVTTASQPPPISASTTQPAASSTIPLSSRTVVQTSTSQVVTTSNGVVLTTGVVVTVTTTGLVNPTDGSILPTSSSISTSTSAPSSSGSSSALSTTTIGVIAAVAVIVAMGILAGFALRIKKTGKRGRLEKPNFPAPSVSSNASGGRATSGGAPSAGALSDHNSGQRNNTYATRPFTPQFVQYNNSPSSLQQPYNSPNQYMGQPDYSQPYQQGGEYTYGDPVMQAAYGEQQYSEPMVSGEGYVDEYGNVQQFEVVSNQQYLVLDQTNIVANTPHADMLPESARVSYTAPDSVSSGAIQSPGVPRSPVVPMN